MSNPIAVEGLTLQILTPGVVGNIHVAPDCEAYGDVTIDGKGVYFNKLKVMLDAGATYGGGTLASPATWDIDGTGESILKVPAEEKALLQEDVGTSSVLVFEIEDSSPATTAVSVKISNAGQNSVFAL